MMYGTPAEKAGIVKGKRYVITRNGTFSKGSVVELYRDDGTVAPLFKLIHGRCEFKRADGYDGAFEFIHYAKVIPEESKSETLCDLFDDVEKTLSRVANLNPDVGEIGEGMLRIIVDEAQTTLNKLNETQQYHRCER